MFDGQTLSLSVNGVLVESSTMAGSLVGRDVAMALGSRCGQMRFQGLMDEVRRFVTRDHMFLDSIVRSRWNCKIYFYFIYFYFIYLLFVVYNTCNISFQVD